MIVINSKFLTQKVTGVQRYAIEICKIIKKHIKNEKIVFVAPKQSLINIDELPNIDVLQIGSFKGNLWEQIDLVFFLKKNNNPILINFSGIGPVYYKNKLLFIHDLAFKHFPEHFSFFFQKSYNLLVPISAKNSKKILTVSNYVKEDISRTLKINDAEVIYPAINSKFEKLNFKKEKIILCVSSIDPRKNIKRIIQAYQELSTDYKLVFIGSESNAFKSQSFSKNLVKSNIVFTGYLNDKKLIEYYNRASIFIYASTFEGFGIPPLEAQSCGSPCIISNVTSLPEVGLDSVIYCNPYSVESIKEKLNLLIKNNELREELVLKGMENIKRFSWEKSSKALSKIVLKNLN